MSVIGRKPLVDKILEGLSEENLAALKSNLDANVIVKYDDFVDLYKNGVLGQVYVPTFNAIFVKPYLLRFNPGSQILKPYILSSDGKLEELDEEISILELRSAMFDVESGGGSSLPEVTSADNEKVLEVISGVWGIGGKKAKVIDLNMVEGGSLVLTDEQIDIIMCGALNNGQIGAYKNPIFIPSDKSVTTGGFYRGFILSTNASNVDTTFVTYQIEIATKKFSLLNNAELLKLSAWQGIVTIGSNTLMYGNGQMLPAMARQTSATSFQLVKRASSIWQEWYTPLVVTGITSGDDLAGVHDNLVGAMKDHLEVEINGFRARYEYTDGNYIVYSSKTESAGGLKLQVNMISLLIASPNTISFNQMTFTPDN